VLVVVSPALAASARCRNEIERSVALRKRIVVVRAQETPVESLPEQLTSLEVVPFGAEDFDTGVRRVLEQLRLIQGGSALGRRCTAGVGRCLAHGSRLSRARPVGYTELYPTLPFVDRLYAALALFRDNTTIYSGTGAVPVVAPPFPWPLEAARWFAPLTLVLAGLSAIFAVLEEPFTRLRIRGLYRRHLVVCGLGHLGCVWPPPSTLVVSGRRCGLESTLRRAFALPGAFNSSAGGDATDPEVLRQAGVERATRVVAVCGDNSVNDESALP